MIYLIVASISIICAYYAQNVKKYEALKSTYIVLSILSLLPILLTSALRYEVGTDWPIYKDYFYKINLGEDRFSEPLFNLLNRIIYLFTDNYWWLFVVCSVIILCLTYKAFYDQSSNIAFSILLYMLSGDFFNSQNQIRQALAMAVFLYAFRYIEERKLKKYLLLVLVACGIHFSAVVYIPLYFLYHRKLNVRMLAGIYVGTVIGLPVLQKLMIVIISKTKYNWYFTSRYNINDFYLLGFLFTSFFVVLYLFYYYYGRKNTECLSREEDYTYNLMTNMYYIAALSVLFSAAIPQMVRITNALSIIGPLLIPRMIAREHNRNRRIVLYFLVLSVMLIKLLYDILHNGWYDAIPYQSIFSK